MLCLICQNDYTNSIDCICSMCKANRISDGVCDKCKHKDTKHCSALNCHESKHWQNLIKEEKTIWQS